MPIIPSMLPKKVLNFSFLSFHFMQYITSAAKEAMSYIFLIPVALRFFFGGGVLSVPSKGSVEH